MAYINAKNAGVTFKIYGSKSRSLRHEFFRTIGGSIKNNDGTTSVTALEAISCEFKDQDRIGLIGHNGAGKSTLLKILSGIYSPTSGVVEIDGSVVSLTDITMGMDPELSGYDNVIMRCVFMGMTFSKAKELATSIIEFSELQDYVDLPMRTYSTGMYLRLAFSVVTSAIPEILVMDELIGTGDSRFIKKAKQRIDTLVSGTKIMILSSHDLDIICGICNRVIWLEHGKIRMDGEPQEVLEEYKKILK
jgi:ABC-type polysaccharide/polyol phosphate transport system ATPase subunit